MVLLHNHGRGSMLLSIRVSPATWRSLSYKQQVFEMQAEKQVVFLTLTDWESTLLDNSRWDVRDSSGSKRRIEAALPVDSSDFVNDLYREAKVKHLGAVNNLFMFSAESATVTDVDMCSTLTSATLSHTHMCLFFWKCFIEDVFTWYKNVFLANTEKNRKAHTQDFRPER